MEEDKVIQIDPSELVLTQEDLGDGWYIYLNESIDSFGYRTAFRSEESGGAASDSRYFTSSRVYKFGNDSDAREFYEESLKNFDRWWRKKVGIGDDAILFDGDSLFVLVFRENNIVVYITHSDFFEETGKDVPIRYARIIEQKIRKAAEDQQPSN